MEKEQSDMLTPEQQEINEKREAYMNAVEGQEGGLTGKVKQIIRAIRGGQMSGGGELRMIVDAERENQLRDIEEDPSRGNTITRSDRRLEKYKKSYLNYSTEDRDSRALHRRGEVARLRGVVNGREVNIEYRDELNILSNEHRKGYSGTIDGEELQASDAREVMEAYKEVAQIQTRDAKNALTKEEEDELARKKGVQVQSQEHMAKKSRDLLRKIVE